MASGESAPGRTTVLIVGGTSGLGRCLAERFARAGHALVLVSSGRHDDAALAPDLERRHGAPVRLVHCDLARADADFGAIDAALSSMPPFTALLLPVGMTRADDRPGLDAAAAVQIHTVNYDAPRRLVEHYLPRLKAAPDGVVVGFGSIAATRERRRNTAYGEAKRALDAYFEETRHAAAGSSLRVQFYVLGYLDTERSASHRTPLPKASPEACAERVYARRRADFGRAYFPRYWRALCWVLRVLPGFIYRRLPF